MFIPSPAAALPRRRWLRDATALPPDRQGSAIVALDPRIRAEIASSLREISDIAQSMRETVIVTRMTIMQSRMFIELADERLAGQK